MLKISQIWQVGPWVILTFPHRSLSAFSLPGSGDLTWVRVLGASSGSTLSQTVPRGLFTVLGVGDWGAHCSCDWCSFLCDDLPDLLPLPLPVSTAEAPSQSPCNRGWKKLRQQLDVAQAPTPSQAGPSASWRGSVLTAPPGPLSRCTHSSGIPHQIVLPRQCPVPSPSFPRACISVLEPVQVSLLIQDCGPAPRPHSSPQDLDGAWLTGRPPNNPGFFLLVTCSLRPRPLCCFPLQPFFPWEPWIPALLRWSAQALTLAPFPGMAYIPHPVPGDYKIYHD